MTEFFKSNLDDQFDPGAAPKGSLNKLTERIKDKDYLEFIVELNGGFFFHKGLHLYGLSESNFHDFFVVNESISKYYSAIAKGLKSIGQDVFGNQFMVSDSDQYFFVNIETGEIEQMANTFLDWVEVLKSDLDFYTGERIATAWELLHGSFPYDERLCPKMPFVVGGEFETNNLYSVKFDRYLDINSNIAKQVYNLPEGQQIRIKTT